MAIATATSTSAATSAATAAAAVAASPSTSGSTSLRTTTTSTWTSSSARWEPNPMQAWWESTAKARAALHSLDAALGPLPFLPSLHDSDAPAKALLDSHEVARFLSARLHDGAAGSAADPLCNWLYDTYQTADSDLQLVVLRYVPLVAGLYLSRVVAMVAEEERHPLAGFEAVVMALYSAEAKARAGRAVVVNIPDLGQPSLYHAPRNPVAEAALRPVVGQLAAPLEPHAAVKSTKRAAIVGVVLDLFYRRIAAMPATAKVEVCEFVQGWAGQNCACTRKLDETETSSSHSPRNPNPSHSPRNPNPSHRGNARLIDEIGKFNIEETCEDGCSNGAAEISPSVASEALFDERRARGARIPLPWELLQPILRILGHCLLGPLNPKEVKDAASSAARGLFARVSHDLVPEAILATRSLIRLDLAARATAASAAAESTASKSNATTPTKRKKPEVHLVSK